MWQRCQALSPVYICLQGGGEDASENTPSPEVKQAAAYLRSPAEGLKSEKQNIILKCKSVNTHRFVRHGVAPLHFLHDKGNTSCRNEAVLGSCSLESAATLPVISVRARRGVGLTPRPCGPLGGISWPSSTPLIKPARGPDRHCAKVLINHKQQLQLANKWKKQEKVSLEQMGGKDRRKDWRSRVQRDQCTASQNFLGGMSEAEMQLVQRCPSWSCHADWQSEGFEP